MTEQFAPPGGFGDWDRAYRPSIRGSITPQLHVIVNLLLLALCISVGLAGFGETGATLGPVQTRRPIPPGLSGASWVAMRHAAAGSGLVGEHQLRRQALRPPH